MLERQSQAPACVYRLADSLDTVLAACEDLVKGSLEPNSAIGLELAAVTHIMQARRLIDELAPLEPAVMDQCTVFLAGTSPFAPEYFGRGNLAHPPRGVFGGNHGSEQALIGNAMPIGVVAQLAAAMLDTLEAFYVLYADDAEPQLAEAA
jgi:hypothetical protein